jgi:hypothetical protein
LSSNDDDVGPDACLGSAATTGGGAFTFIEGGGGVDIAVAAALALAAAYVAATSLFNSSMSSNFTGLVIKLS